MFFQEKIKKKKKRMHAHTWVSVLCQCWAVKRVRFSLRHATFQFPTADACNLCRNPANPGCCRCCTWQVLLCPRCNHVSLICHWKRQDGLQTIKEIYYKCILVYSDLNRRTFLGFTPPRNCLETCHFMPLQCSFRSGESQNKVCSVQWCCTSLVVLSIERSQGSRAV